MSLPVYDTKEAIPASDVADFAEYNGKWHQKDLVAAWAEAARVKSINAGLITEKGTALTAKEAADAEVARLSQELAGKESGLEPAKLEAYAAPIRTKLTEAETKATALQVELDRVKLLEEMRKTAVAAGMWMERVDDEDETDALLKRVAIKDGVLVSVDKKGNVLPTPPVELFKSLLPTKPYLFPFKGGQGGDAQHSTGTPDAGPRTAATDLKKINDQRAAQPNPLARTVAKV